jgi:hypothetical protein
MPDGFLVTGGVSQMGGAGFLVIGDIGDVNPDGECINRKWELGVSLFVSFQDPSGQATSPPFWTAIPS